MTRITLAALGAASLLMCSTAAFAQGSMSADKKAMAMGSGMQLQRARLLAAGPFAALLANSFTNPGGT